MLVGIVGKPSCGKSTFFKAHTLANVEIANYPFTTIKPNHGTGFVRVNCVDKDFNTKCNQIGKSTFFKAHTLANVEIANYPFTTIKPNHGTGFVRVNCVDKDFNTKCNPRFGYCIDSKRFV